MARLVLSSLEGSASLTQWLGEDKLFPKAETISCTEILPSGYWHELGSGGHFSHFAETDQVRVAVEWHRRGCIAHACLLAGSSRVKHVEGEIDVLILMCSF